MKIRIVNNLDNAKPQGEESSAISANVVNFPILTDLGSTHGTIVKGQRLLPNEPLVLVDGAVFRIGPYSLIYQTIESTTHPLDQDGKQLPRLEVEEGGARLADEASSPLQQDVLAINTPYRSGELAPPGSLEHDPGSIYLYNLPDIFQENESKK